MPLDWLGCVLIRRPRTDWDAVEEFMRSTGAFESFDMLVSREKTAVRDGIVSGSKGKRYRFRQTRAY